MKKESKESTVGTATKYMRVKFDVAKIVAMYKSGKPGFPDREGHWLPAQPGTESGKQCAIEIQA
jgi:hypothetical protein